METLPTVNVTAKAMPAVDTNIRGPFGSAVQGPIPDVPEPAFGSEVAAQDGPASPVLPPSPTQARVPVLPVRCGKTPASSSASVPR